MIELFKKRDFFGLAVFFISLGILVWYFAAKLTIFSKMGYQSDLYTHLEIARGWLQGRPLMHENCYGYHNKLHNYFFDLLMGPLAKQWGAIGIFITQFALYVVALVYTFPTIYKKDESLNHRLLAAVFYLAIFCAPYAFWLYDDPHYGFHTEMLYIPLGFVFAISLYKKQHWVSVLAALLMLSVKEDGAVIVACIHLLFIALQQSAKKITVKRWLLQSLLWGGIWIACFATGVYYLKAQNNFGYDRITESFERISLQNTQDIRTYFIGVFSSFGLMLLPFALFLVFIRQLNYKAWLWWLAFSIPIIIVNLISGFVYFPAQSFSLTWVPRFSLILSLFLAMSSFSLLMFSRAWFRPAFVCWVAAIVVGYSLFNWQKKLLKSEIDYSYYQNSQKIFRDDPPHKYYPYWNNIRKVSQVLPEMYPVAPPYPMFGYFHKQDVIWTNVIFNAHVWPRMIICDNSNSENVVADQLLQHPDSVITKDVKYYFEREDRHYLIDAGITPK